MGLIQVPQLLDEPHLIPQRSAYYLKTPHTQATATLQPTEDVTYYQPIYLNGSTSFDRISMQTQASFSGTAVYRLGIYNASIATGKPTTVYLDAGTVSATAASTTYEITISITPPKGFYYLAVNMQTAPTNSNTLATTTSGTVNNFAAPSVFVNLQGSTPQPFWTQSGVTGAFATAGSLTVASQVILAGLRIV